MAFDGLLITEIFHSIQGETSRTGLPFVFVRLSGCNLRCTYCDTTYAFKGGERLSLDEVLEKVAAYGAREVLLTGGEPLLQRPTPRLVDALNERGYQVSIETHGEVSVAAVAGKARLIMDIKTPSSGMCRGQYVANLPLLTEKDEIKFVIASEEDYTWAKERLSEIQAAGVRAGEILFSPMVAPLEEGAGSSNPTFARWLAEKILADRLNVRFQLQLHKILWGADSRGV